MSIGINKIFSTSKNTPHPKAKQELELKELELCIENTVKFIKDELHLNDELIEEHLPILIKKSAYHDLPRV